MLKSMDIQEYDGWEVSPYSNNFLQNIRWLDPISGTEIVDLYIVKTLGVYVIRIWYSSDQDKFKEEMLSKHITYEEIVFAIAELWKEIKNDQKI